MKKQYLIQISLLTLLCVIFFKSSAHAKQGETEKDKRDWGFSIGYNQHYSWWQPVWGKKSTPILLHYYYSLKYLVATYAKFDDMRINKNAGLMYNPVFSFRFNPEWSLSGSFLYGKVIFKGTERGFTWNVTEQNFSKNDAKLEAEKYDAEVLINVNITNWLKIFFGPKYQGYRMKDILKNIAGSGVAPFFFLAPKLTDNIRFHSGGFGTGCSFAVKIYAGLYSLSSLSGIFLVGEDISGGSSWSKSQQSVLVGGLASSSFGYFIEPAGLTISAGFKFQFLYYTKTPRPDHKENYDMFYGPFMSVVYTF